jgi:hypothetical protein
VEVMVLEWAAQSIQRELDNLSYEAMGIDNIPPNYRTNQLEMDSDSHHYNKSPWPSLDNKDMVRR